MPVEQQLAKIAPKFHFSRAFPRGHWESDLCLWQLPGYLRQIWWSRAEESLRDESVNEGFYRHVRQFLGFKDYPFAEEAVFSVDVLEAERQDQALTGKRGAANLGDGRVTVVVTQGGSENSFILNPGDGITIPAGAALTSRSTAGESETEILLTFSLAARAG